jgi:uncharacterized protein YggE
MIRSRLIAATFLAFATAVTAQTIQVSKDNRTIAITTTDEAEMLADRAQVSIGYTVYGTNQDSTYADASRVSNAVMQALKDAGIKPEAIESREQNVSPIDDNDKARYAKGIRFVASQSWTVTVSASDAANVLHIAITAGANNSGNIDWQLADDQALQAQAAEKALVHARQIAERMTKSLNVNLGPLVYASNQLPPQPSRQFDRLSSYAKIGVPVQKNLKPLAIRPEKISRSATVYAVFSLQ